MVRRAPSGRARAAGARVFAALLLCLLVPAEARAGSAGWREIAPLPTPRWFHRAASDLKGRIYAFAGDVKPPDVYSDAGLGPWSLVIYDPSAKAWRPGPPAPSYQLRARVRAYITDVDGTLSRGKPNLVATPAGPSHELPSGAAGRDGRIYWFATPGPIFFDPRRGVWDQPLGALQDNETLRWLSSVPRYDREAGVTATGPDGRIYLAGGEGYLLDRSQRDPNPRNLYALLDSLEIYDPKTNTWSQGAPLRRARQLCAGAFGPDGKLYVFGGYGHKRAVYRENYTSDAAYQKAVRRGEWLSRHALRSVEAYDPQTHAWEARAPMPQGRHAMGAALGADGRIYVVGGAVSYSHPRGERDVFVYDPRRDTWSRGPSLHQGRFHHAVAVDPNGRIYALGGQGQKGPFGLGDVVKLASVEVLDTAPASPPQRPRPAAPAP